MEIKIITIAVKGSVNLTPIILNANFHEIPHHEPEIKETSKSDISACTGHTSERYP